MSKYEICYYILSVVSINFIGFVFFDNPINNDLKIILPIAGVSIFIMHICFNKFTKEKRFLILDSIFILAALFINYFVINPIINVDNHGYLFFILFGLSLPIGSYILIKEKGKNCTVNFFLKS